MIRSQTLLLRGLLMVSGLLLAGQTWAACTYSPRMNLGTLTVNPGLVQVAQAAAIGDVVSTTIVNIGGSYPVWIGQCDSSTGNGGFSISLSGTQGALVPGLLRVYNTNIQGIGYRIRTLGDNPNIWPTGTGVSTGTSSSIYVGWRSIQFELVKTAAVVGNGPLTPGNTAASRSRAIRANLTSSSCWARPASSAPPAASMRARRTSPCRSARSTAMRSRAWARRWPSETSRSGSTAMPCRRDKETRS